MHKVDYSSITVSFNPLYHCNFRCDFCYLSKSQLSDPRKLSLDIFEERLKELIDHGKKIDHIDLYGGEVALLGEEYLREFDEIVQRAGDPTINIITNFSKMTPYFFTEHTELSVSFDFEARQSHETVIQNLLMSPKEVSILILATERVLEMDVDYMISTLNAIKTVKSVEIKPYSSNQANQHLITHSMFENFVIEWIKRRDNFQFNFSNITELENALGNRRNAFSDDHIYITPRGKFAVLDFDEFDHEYFHELSNFQDYYRWTVDEKLKISSNSFCSQCEFLGKCLTEHYRNVEDLSGSCNGYFNLIKWYQRSIV